ncbi:helix-turn-helix domain-containing protein [Anaerospora hongkongensis]|uniref:helix-turn-helix domain-containing protein n=1 Tax=Anaerospora hongkongensis TaxID=244830 RepID=UPI002FDA4BAA
MNDLTLKAIGDSLGIPEATLRFYRDRYAEFIPCVGEGRTRRYPAAAVEVFKTIADSTKAGKKPEEITNYLYSNYAINPTAITATEAQGESQQPQRNEKTLNAMTAIIPQSHVVPLPEGIQAVMIALAEEQNSLLKQLLTAMDNRNNVMADGLPDVLTFAEAAALARVSVRTLHRRKKEDPKFPAGGIKKRIAKQEFLKWLGGNATATQTQ